MRLFGEVHVLDVNARYGQFFRESPAIIPERISLSGHEQ